MKVEHALAKSSPLVFAGECRQLHEHLGKKEMHGTASMLVHMQSPIRYRCLMSKFDVFPLDCH